MNKRDKLLEGMLLYPTMTKAIEYANISTSTAYKYLRDKTFQNELRTRKNEIMQGVTNYLQQSLCVGAEELVSIVKDKNINAQVKIYAINTLFSISKNLIEMNDIINKIEQIENKLKEYEENRNY